MGENIPTAIIPQQRLYIAANLILFAQNAGNGLFATLYLSIKPFAMVTSTLRYALTDSLTKFAHMGEIHEIL